MTAASLLFIMAGLLYATAGPSPSAHAQTESPTPPSSSVTAEPPAAPTLPASSTAQPPSEPTPMFPASSTGQPPVPSGSSAPEPGAPAAPAVQPDASGQFVSEVLGVSNLPTAGSGMPEDWEHRARKLAAQVLAGLGGALFLLGATLYVARRRSGA